MSVQNNQTSTASRLDHQKLLGFRNLQGLQTSDTSLAKSSDLAFNKIGSELPPGLAR
ncbi:hypothetical protein [Bradyrhizobium sp.]|uniref:hypothetical protein n=1 Tax=Bradyrhizobium sp. TaxID=376 RepID=UPI0039E29C65